jgi:FtsP/CotA-like multicopper oxidase with cupredoxin domain
LTAALVLVVVAMLGAGARAEEAPAELSHPHHTEEMGGMEMSAERMVMNQNTDRLPRDCTAISRDVSLTVHAGKAYAAAFPGTMYGYDAHQWNVPACARVTVTLINDDHVRHQWMVHGLPRYLYPEGMFHLEVSGRNQGSGTFIVPSSSKTYLVHCDVSQHAEKGMKAELKVAGGDGDLPSIPGISAPLEPDAYPMRWDVGGLALAAAAALAGAVLALAALRR